MTADERIEELLNRFGQTISDLPKPGKQKYAYGVEHMVTATNEALKWHGFRPSGFPDSADYICHLTDIIDRMEAALDTAMHYCYCGYCEKATSESVECNGCDPDNVEFKIADWVLEAEE